MRKIYTRSLIIVLFFNIQTCIAQVQDINLNFWVTGAYGGPAPGSVHSIGVSYNNVASDPTGIDCNRLFSGGGWLDFPEGHPNGRKNYTGLNNFTPILISLDGYVKKCLYDGGGSNGDLCQYISQCYCSPGIKCSGTNDSHLEYHSVNFDWFNQGEPGIINITEIITPNIYYALRIAYYYTPPIPSNIVLSSGSNNICGGENFTLTSGSLKAGGEYVWQESSDGNNWQTIAIQSSSVLSRTAPTNAPASGMVRYYRVFKRHNNVLSKFPSPAISVFIYPPRPGLFNNDRYRTITHVSCHGTSTGKIKIEKVDGVSGYKWSLKNLSNGGFPILNSTVPLPLFPDDASNKGTITGLPAGTYELTVEYVKPDNSAICPTKIQININQPSALSLGNPVLSNYNGYNIRCFDEDNGSIGLSGNGGIPPYLFTLAETPDFSGQTGSNTSGLFENLKAGIYYARISDSKGCAAPIQIIPLTQPSPLTGNFTSSDISCYGFSNGSISFVNVSGGKEPYFFSINNGMDFSTSNFFENLPQGLYTCLISDINGCTVSENIMIHEPDLLEMSGQILRQVSCHGGDDGALEITAQGGTGNYTYSLNNGSFSISPLFSFIPAAEHFLQVKDGNNCIASDSITLEQPEPLDIFFLISHVQCNGFNNGNITADVSGGIPPYTYLWNTGTGNNPVRENLSPGDYQLQIRDQNNCMYSASAQITEPEDGLTAEIVFQKGAICNAHCTGEAEISVHGGTPPYTSIWNNPGSDTGFHIRNLCKGIYRAEITDSKNCATSATIQIEDSISINFNIPSHIVLCPGQEIRLDAENPGSTYQWKKNSGTLGYEKEVVLSEEGSYTLQITDVIGCSDTYPFAIRVAADLLRASFLLPSEAAIGDTVVFIETSWPQPQFYEWHFGNNVTVIDAGPYQPKITFTEAGEYTVKMIAWLGECVDSMVKKITFYIPEKEDDTQRKNFLGFNRIEEMKIFPNPNHGIFQLDIKMQQADYLKLGIFDSQGHCVTSRYLEGEDHYKVNFILPLRNGVYVLRAENPGDYKTMSFVVY